MTVAQASPKLTLTLGLMPICMAAVAPRWGAALCSGALGWPLQPCPSRQGQGQESLPQSGLCALCTDTALLTNDLSNSVAVFNPSRDHCYIDLYIGCRAAFIADVFLER